MEKTRVMVVDDELDFLKLLKMNLDETGKYEVLTLSNAKHIIAQVQNFKPDVMLLDILMPSIGGIEVCEMLNRDTYGKGVPVIILSALQKEHDKLEAYKVGVVDYLIKPVDIDTLVARIERAVALKKGMA